MLQQAQAMFKTMASARVANGSDNDFKINECTPYWNIKSFLKNSKKQDILNVLLKQTMNTYVELSFVYVDGKATMFVKSYTKDDNSLTIYSGEGKYIEKGEYFPQSGTYKRYWTKQDVVKQGRIAADPEYAYDILLNEVVVIAYGNNSTTSSQWIPVISFGNNSSNVNPNPSNPLYYYPGNYSASTGSTPIANSMNDIMVTPNLPDCLKYPTREVLTNIALLDNSLKQVLATFNSNNHTNNLTIRPITSQEMKDQNLQVAMATTRKQANGQGWVMELNTDFLEGSSKQFIAAVVLHELYHIRAENEGVVSYQNHDNYFTKDYVNNIASDLKGIYSGMSDTDSKALAAAGVLGSGNTEEKFGLTTNQVSNIASKYQKNQLGSQKCSN